MGEDSGEAPLARVEQMCYNGSGSVPPRARAPDGLSQTGALEHLALEAQRRFRPELTMETV
jgi:hypothetical protein